MNNIDINKIYENTQINFNKLISSVHSGSFDQVLQSLGNLSTATDFISTVKIAHDNFLLYKMKKLYNEIKENIDNRENKDALINKIKDNAKKRIKQTNLLLMAIEQEIVEEKIQYYANLMFLLLAEEINSNTFELYIEMVDDLYLQDLKAFFNMHEDQKAVREYKRSAVYPTNPRMGGISYSFDPRQIIRINRTGLLNAVPSQRMGMLGMVESYDFTSQAIHFICCIKGDLTDYYNYCDK